MLPRSLLETFCLCNEFLTKVGWGVKMLCPLRIAPTDHTDHSPTFSLNTCLWFHVDSMCHNKKAISIVCEVKACVALSHIYTT